MFSDISNECKKFENKDKILCLQNYQVLDTEDKMHSKFKKIDKNSHNNPIEMEFSDKVKREGNLFRESYHSHRK